ncbi:MAG: MAPEG family protein [Micropepsaceae bacterium]
MTLELSILSFSCVLCVVQIVLASHAASFQRGYRWTASARDDVQPPLTGVAGRLARAQTNFLETFPVFVAVVLIAHVLSIHDWRTQWGAGLYLGGRVFYVPLYAFGVPLVRSLAWNVAIVGVFLILWAIAEGVS